jgi:NADH:ubiquinone oxidoreductase subunit C
MSRDSLVALVDARLPGRGLVSLGIEADVEVIAVPARSLLDVARFLTRDADAAYDLLYLTAVDRFEFLDRNAGTPRFVLLVALVSRTHQSRARLEVEIDDDAGAFPSLTSVWPSAFLYELEVLDLFGLTPEGHPQPHRLLLPDGFVGHPLRLDYRVGKHQPQVPPPSSTPERVDAPAVVGDRP